MLPFDAYPEGGRRLLGRLRSVTASCRTGYGLALQRIIGQSLCAYCGVDLVADYHRWLLLQVDHVVPAGEALRLGIPAEFYQDAINQVLACAGCNGFLNRYACHGEFGKQWTMEEFVDFRDAVFADRFQRIQVRRATDVAFFTQAPWLQGRVGTARPHHGDEFNSAPLADERRGCK